MPSLVVGRSTLDDLVASARLAEAAGFESIWATEFYDHSATVGIAAMAGATETIGRLAAPALADSRQHWQGEPTFPRAARPGTVAACSDLRQCSPLSLSLPPRPRRAPTT